MSDKISVSITDLVLLGATRAMAGAGLALLLARRISPQKRRKIGLPLLLVGAVSTVPLLIGIFGKRER